MTLTVGLTGGIGSGKSSVSTLLAGHGAIIVDYDVLAREAVLPGSEGLRRIAERFGPNVIAGDGTLDRAALGSIVFADAAARLDLEAITHPAIRALAEARAAAAGPEDVVIHDNPLLVEMGQYRSMDVVLVVDVPEDVQVERLVTLRGMTADDARARIAAQTSRDDRAAVADHVIDNSGSEGELAARVGGLWPQLAQAAREGQV